MKHTTPQNSGEKIKVGEPSVATTVLEALKVVHETYKLAEIVGKKIGAPLLPSIEVESSKFDIHGAMKDMLGRAYAVKATLMSVDKKLGEVW
jgi:hypothetical protein